MKGQKATYKYTNALIHETSPYLLEHAHNPVDWRPWSQQALQTAKKENKLVLVSIGYSSCHWCHVMEEETFEDEEVGKLMNENFISIKVDREERPDVDQVYMTALQLIKGNGGWPLNVITLPNGKPIYGGTYHTKEQWKEVLLKVSNLYKKDPQKANEYADRLAEGIQQANVLKPSENTDGLTLALLEESVKNWKPNWDLEWGGNKGSQKFMLPSNLLFLMDYSVLSKDISAQHYVTNTLDKIALGGVYDHIGGGFFRYSTDRKWKVPHFEKMLYDNAQLISLYSKAYRLYKKPLYKKVVLETIAFLEREMKNPKGGFYAALDADSEGEEGKFYIWKEEELKSILKGDFDLFASYYNTKPATIWEKGNFVLYQTLDENEFVKKRGLSRSNLDKKIQQWKKELLKARGKRIRPRTDDKIIISWNALLINGFVDAYKAFGKQEFLDSAVSILKFIENNAYKEGQLVHSYKENSKRIDGFLEDYTFMANAALNLYGVTMDEKYLDLAKKLTDFSIKEFADPASDMYRYNRSQELISKILNTDDGVLPSPNSIMAHNLFQLGHIYYDTQFMDKAKKMLSSMEPMIESYAYSYSQWNTMLLQVVYPYYEVSIVGGEARTKLDGLNQKYIPNILVVGSEGNNKLPLFEGRYDPDETLIYVCRDNTCKLPVGSVEKALHQLEDF